MPDIKFKRLHPRAKIPTKQTDGAAAFDVIATSREGSIYGLGFAVAIPKGYHLALYSRSGHGFKGDKRLANCVGIVDSDYRGEIKVKLTYDGEGYEDWPYVGDRIAQCMLVRNIKTTWTEVEELDETDRGEDGFGSTGQ